MSILNDFRLLKSHVITPGGRKSLVADVIDAAFTAKAGSKSSFIPASW
jgi:hypothetical protein